MTNFVPDVSGKRFNAHATGDKILTFSSPSGIKRLFPDGLLALGLWRNTSVKNYLQRKK